MYTHGGLIVLAFLVLGNYDNVYTWSTCRLSFSRIGELRQCIHMVDLLS